MNPNTPQPKTNVSPTQEQSKQIPTSGDDAKKEMAWSIRSSINKNGRYSYEVDRLALGFAAGANISHFEARKKVEQAFESEMKISAKEYLERHRRERGLKVEQTRSR